METTELEKLRLDLAKLQIERDQLEKENKALQKEITITATSKTQFTQRISIKKVLKEGRSLKGQTVVLCGWVRTVRDYPQFAFVELNDGSCFKGFQVVVDATIPGFADVTGVNAGVGACVWASGTIVVPEKATQDVELQAQSVQLVGKCVPGDYPLAATKGQRVPMDVLRGLLHLRGRTNTFGAAMRVRNACTMATHNFFQSQGMINLHTPLITASDCEGAGEMFQITTLLKNGTLKLGDVAVNKETGKPDYTQDFFGKPAFLTVSGQLNGEMYACGLGRIYTFGPTFRAEVSNTTRHMSEFWMIEPEVAFNDLDDNMDLAEAYIKFVINFVMQECPDDIAFFDKFVKKGLVESLKKIASTPFKRLTYTEAIDILLKVNPKNKKFENPVSWGIDLASEHERYIAEEVIKGPVFLTDYPKDIKAFYMRMNEDGKTVRAMDLLVPGIGELIGGSQREERLEELEKRIEECHLDKEAYKYYLDLRRFGTCPHAGFGLGFERLIMFVTGIDNIKDTIPFPRYPKHADC